MLTDWTKHIADPDEAAKFKQEIINCKTALERLDTILEEQTAALDRSEMRITVYDTPNWAERQAHKNGNREAFGYLQTLIRSTYDR